MGPRCRGFESSSRYYVVSWLERPVHTREVGFDPLRRYIVDLIPLAQLVRALAHNRVYRSPSPASIVILRITCPAEGNGLENRRACKSVRGSNSHPQYNADATGSSSARNPEGRFKSCPAIWLGSQLVEQWIEAPCVGGSDSVRAISFNTSGV